MTYTAIDVKITLVAKAKQNHASPLSVDIESKAVGQNQKTSWNC